MLKIKWFLSSNLSLVYGNWEPNLSNDDHPEMRGHGWWWVPNHFLEHCVSKDSSYDLRYKKQVNDSLKIYSKVKLKSYSYKKPFKGLIIHSESEWYDNVMKDLELSLYFCFWKLNISQMGPWNLICIQSSIHSNLFSTGYSKMILMLNMLLHI